VTPRGRADAFARVLDGGPGGRPDGDPELAALADLAARLREVPTQALRPEVAFRTELRARLVAEAEGLRAVREHLPAPRRPAEPAAPRRTPRRLLAGVLAATLLGGTGAAVASTAALPGELLYPVKRGVEQVRLGLSAGDAARGATELSLARTRLDEAEMLLLRGGAGDSQDRAVDALQDFSDAAVAGSGLLLEAYAADGDRRHLEEVADFGRDVRPRLERMRLSAGPEVDAVISQVVARLAVVDLQLHDAAAACGPACAGLLASLTPLPGTTGPAVAPDPSAPAGVSPSALPDAAGPAPAPVVTGLVPAPGGAPQDPALPGAVPAPDGARVDVGGEGVSADVGGRLGAGLDPGGVGAQLPGSQVTAPAPSVGVPVPVPLPTATVGDTVVDPGDTAVDPGGLGDDETCTVVVLGRCILP